MAERVLHNAAAQDVLPFEADMELDDAGRAGRPRCHRGVEETVVEDLLAQREGERDRFVVPANRAMARSRW